MATTTRPVWAPNELLKHERELMRQSPGDIPGTTIHDVLIPARGFMRARTLEPGQIIRFIDVEGQQVPDVLLYDSRNLKNCSSMANSVLLAQTWKLTKGHAIYSKMGEKMATIVEDTVGVNVSMGGFCNPAANELRYGIEGTHSCRLNLVGSMAEYGLAPLDIEEGVFVPFMNMAYQTDGTCEIAPPTSKPGDYLEFQAEMRIIAAVSNCPSEHNPCNNWNPTPLRIIVYSPGSDSGVAS